MRVMLTCVHLVNASILLEACDIVCLYAHRRVSCGGICVSSVKTNVC